MSIMVSVMEFDANRELCDGGPRFDASTIGGPLGAVMQTPTVHDICSDAPAEDEEKDGGDRSTTATEAATAVADKPELRLELAAGQRLAADRLDDGEKDSCQSKSPMSPTSSSSKTGNKTVAVAAGTAVGPQIGQQKEVIDDRKALRDALYQGIFHRHRRTIFAMGSFIRMLKSRSSQYNTIRSASDGEDEPR